MSSVEDQVERKVLRAETALRRSRNIITVSSDELESHRRWLDHHRSAWAEEVQRCGRLLNRKLAIRAFARGAVSLILAPHRALVQAFPWAPKQRSPRASQTSLVEIVPDRPGYAQLQHRICTLGEQSVTRAGVPSSTPGRLKVEEECSSRARCLPGRGVLSKGTVLLSALGFITLFVIGAGAVRSTISEAPALEAREVLYRPPSTPASSVPEAKAHRSPILGFSILAAMSAPKPLLLPAPTIADMMLITSPLALDPIGREVKTAPSAVEPLASKPAVLTKPKRKLATRKPTNLPWLQELPWVKVR